MDFDDLSKQIANSFPALSPQLQVAARYVLDRPDDVALMSMRSLAASAAVHPSTMVRLAKSFGCDSYQNFRAPFQHRLRMRPEGFLVKARNLQARGSEGEAQLTQEVLSANLANLRETFEINSPERFEAAAKELGAARRVFVVGMRGVYPVAYFFQYAYSMFRDNSVLLDGRGGAFSDGLRSFGRNDVILAISFNPYTVETVRAIDYAKEHDGKAVVITDSPVSPLAKNADQVLIIKNESPSFYHSVAAGVTVAEELIALLVLDGGKEALDAIEESEQQLDSFHAYWHQNDVSHKKRKKNSK
jgi:DNA-binding MurR/RpiR family transcriptional regulator